MYPMPTQSAPLVSIIIAACVTTPRQAQLLGETLHTVAAQTFQGFEIIVVDDGSPLNVRAVTAGHTRTRTLRQENAGPAMARNTGIRASRGKHIVFLDADDHLLPEGLEAGLCALAAHPECGFAVGGREEMTYEGDPVSWRVATLQGQTQLYHSLLGFDCYIIPPSSVMFRRDVVQAIGDWRDPWGADDLDYYLRVSHRYKGWCFDQPAVTRYRRYSTSSSRDGERMLRSLRAVYARQWALVKADPVGEAAFDRGLMQLTEIFTACLAENLRDHLRAGNWRRALRCTALLARESPQHLLAEAARLLAAQRC